MKIEINNLVNVSGKIIRYFECLYYIEKGIKLRRR